MAFKDKPYWLRGVLIGFFIQLVLIALYAMVAVILFFSIGAPSTGIIGLILKSCWRIVDLYATVSPYWIVSNIFVNLTGKEDFDLPVSVEWIMTLTLSFAIGALLGAGCGKLKKR